MVKLNDNPYCWQGPGGSKPFDSNLDEWKNSKLTKRYIYILKFLFKNKNSKILIFDNQKDFNKIICDFLDLNNINRPKKPTPAHFYTPFQFVDFIGKKTFIDSKKFELFITDSGERFLKEIENENFDTALKIYLDQLFNTKFPNEATVGVDLKLYPARIMFKLLFEKGKISKFMFLKDIQYINSYLDVQYCLMLLDDIDYLSKLSDLENLKEENNDEFNKLNINLAKEKWNSYVCGGLVSLGILDKQNFKKGFIKLSDKGINYLIEKKIDEIDYESMFY